MTYYELVSYLDSLINKPEIVDSDIDTINSKDISLTGTRYYRFIGQLNVLMTERLYNFRDNVEEKLGLDYMSSSDLILSMDPLRKEIEGCMKLLNIKYIKDENKNEFIKSIKKANNETIERLKEYFPDEERLNIMDSYMMEDNDEL